MNLTKAYGSMYAAAFGDSLGAAVEFLSLDKIKKKYGEDGITVPDSAFGHPAGVITDDTQLAIATLKGILVTPGEEREDIERVVVNVFASHIGWLHSQDNADQRRSPGPTTLSALKSGQIGSLDHLLNTSNSCGGVMKIHPVGIMYQHDPELAFELGIRIAAITHGGPNAQYPAGFMAMLVALLAQDVELGHALLLTRDHLVTQGERALESLEALDRAFDAPRHDGKNSRYIDIHVGRFSKTHPGGWEGHDALAIGVYSVLCAENNPVRAVQIAVNHSGDSDSTGAIAGAIAGAIHEAKPFERFLAEHEIMLEAENEITNLVGLIPISPGPTQREVV